MRKEVKQKTEPKIKGSFFLLDTMTIILLALLIYWIIGWFWFFYTVKIFKKHGMLEDHMVDIVIASFLLWPRHVYRYFKN